MEDDVKHALKVDYGKHVIRLKVRPSERPDEPTCKTRRHGYG